MSKAFRKALQVGNEASLLGGVFLLGMPRSCFQTALSAASLRKGCGEKKKCRWNGDPCSVLAVRVDQAYWESQLSG